MVTPHKTIDIALETPPNNEIHTEFKRKFLLAAQDKGATIRKTEIDLCKQASLQDTNSETTKDPVTINCIVARFEGPQEETTRTTNRFEKEMHELAVKTALQTAKFPQMTRFDYHT